MPRERSTWNVNAIAKRAGLKVADPYLMNQDHVNQQPAADEYVIGGPSEFAEDVHPAATTWEAEYSNGQVKRNEIGMPDMRSDTFNHPEKTASEEVITKKAALCVAIARKMLPKTASATEIEDQSFSLMYLPDTEVMATYTRLAAQDDQQDQQQGQQQVQAAQQDQQQGQQQQVQANDQQQQGQAQQDQKQAGQQDQQQQQQVQAAQQDQQQVQANDQQQQGQAQQDQKQAGQIPPQFLENVKKKKEEAEGKKDDKDQGQQKAAQQGQQDQGQQDQGQQKQAEMQQQGMQQQLAQLIQQAQQIQDQLAQSQQQAGQQQQQAGQQQQQQAQMQQQSQAQQIAQAVQQAIQNGQDPVAAVQQIQGQYQQQGQSQQQSNNEIDQMLAEQGQVEPMSNMDIQLDTPSMDVGEVQLSPEEDDTLRQLFSSNQEYKNAAEAAGQQDQDQGQQQQRQANTVVRTASMRTVGTRPSAGVSQIGGSNRTASSHGDDLSTLWNSAPDVREAFGMRTDQ